jgi:hypothetical protein
LHNQLEDIICDLLELELLKNLFWLKLGMLHSEPTPHQEEGEFRPSVAGKFLGLHLHEERKLF